MPIDSIAIKVLLMKQAQPFVRSLEQQGVKSALGSRQYLKLTDKLGEWFVPFK